MLARRLRIFAKLPATRLDETRWSAQPTLWGIWRQERKRWAHIYILNQRAMAAFQIKNALRETTEDILGREIIMKSMPLNRLNQKMLLIDGMSSLVLALIQTLFQERGCQIQTG